MLLPGHLDALAQFDAFPGHFYMVDKKGHILFCNHAQAQATGADHSSEIIGKNMLSLSLLRDNPTIIMAHENNQLIMRLNQTCELIEDTTINGKPSFCLTHKAPIYAKDSHAIIGIYGYSVYITDLENPLGVLSKRELVLKNCPRLDSDLRFL